VATSRHIVPDSVTGISSAIKSVKGIASATLSLHQQIALIVILKVETTLVALTAKDLRVGCSRALKVEVGRTANLQQGGNESDREELGVGGGEHLG
jgi:hypothetical protein